MCMLIYFNIRKTSSFNKKNKYAYISNKHAQNYTTYAQNGAFTNGTPYFIRFLICLLRMPIVLL